ncbi:MAG: SIS domain-containing protein [Candidatus Micrarchaeota archaeon]|nr:SIS domain-containing protein [Candidatus Micrarchaeota archaeon]
MNKLEEIYRNSKSPEEYATKYLDYLTTLFKSLDKNSIRKVIDEFQKARKNGKMIYFIGNGGSAATAMHFALDLEKGTDIKKGFMFKTESLVNNVSYLTAVANDSNFEEIFVSQLKAKLNEGDVLVGISASGNSPNLVKAFEYAKTKKARIIGLLGFDGGKMKVLSDVIVHVVTARGEYGPVEDIHMVLDHIITTFLYFSERDSK